MYMWPEMMNCCSHVHLSLWAEMILRLISILYC